MKGRIILIACSLHIDRMATMLQQFPDAEIIFDEKSPYQEAVIEGKLPQLEIPIVPMQYLDRDTFMYSVKEKAAKVLPIHANCKPVRTKKSFNKKLSRSYIKR